MACKTCRREDMPDDCGSKDQKPCPCCGLTIIASAEEEAVPDNEEREE